MKPSTVLLIAVGSVTLNFTGMILWSILDAWTIAICHAVIAGISANAVLILALELDKETVDAE